MCEFKSAIVTRNGDVLANPWTDSHEDLIRLFKLRDNREGSFARVEFTPDEQAELDQPEKYKLTIDEGRCPDWFDEDMKAKVSDKMRGWIKAMVVSDVVDLLCGGVYVLSKGARVSLVKNCRLVVMLGNSTVGEMWESSKVGEMWGSSTVGTMRESSKVGEMWGSSTVGEMWESSKVGEMWGSSKVGTMWESSKVGEMLGSSKVGTMWESSKVGTMRESSKVAIDNRNPK